MEISHKKQLSLLIWLACLVYFVSYVTRLNYGTLITEIIAKTGMSKSAAGLISTCSFFSYGIGQPISGILSDKLRPRNIIMTGITVTSIINLIFPFINSPALMAFLWTINGFSQALLWPPIFRLLSDYAPEDTFKKAILRLYTVCNAATLILYVLAPAFIEYSTWQTMFCFCGGIGILTAAIWFVLSLKIEKSLPKLVKEQSKPLSQSNNQTSFSKLLLSSGLIMIFISIMLQGMLKDGVSTWAPVFLSDTFKLSSSASILISMALPVFSVFSTYIAAFIYRKIFKNELTCTIAIYATSALSAFALAALFGKSAITSVLLMAVITSCMHGVNLMLISYVPMFYAKYDKASTVTGTANFFAYFGSAISSYLIAILTEKFGWSFTVLSWGIISVLGIMFSLLALKKWNRFRIK